MQFYLRIINVSSLVCKSIALLIIQSAWEAKNSGGPHSGEPRREIPPCAKIGLKVLVSEAVGASMRKKMKKEVKSSSFDNHRFTTLPMLSDNVIHQVSPKSKL